jgi:hypothetical protein
MFCKQFGFLNTLYPKKYPLREMLFSCLARSMSISMTEAAMKESRPLVGSSQNNSGGLVRTLGQIRIKLEKKTQFVQAANGLITEHQRRIGQHHRAKTTNKFLH